MWRWWGVAFRSFSNEVTTESRQGGENRAALSRGACGGLGRREAEWLEERTVGLGTRSGKGDKT